MARAARNLAASVRARLLALAKARGENFDLILTRFALERLLYRLGQSPHAGRFVLKGAMLLATWLDDPHRSTRDLDLLGFGDPEPEAMLGVFRDILALQVDDGVQFDTGDLRMERIRESAAYGGLRLKTAASIATARIVVTIDVGFGDATEPGIELIDYPVMLDLPAPRVRAYARETVIAEKLHAMVVLGRVNTRMKDFYDIWSLNQAFAFDGDRLAQAIAATFARRHTPIPTEPIEGLSAVFAEDMQKRQQWRAFVDSLGHDPGTLMDVVRVLADFLMPHVAAAARRQSKLS